MSGNTHFFISVLFVLYEFVFVFRGLKKRGGFVHRHHGMQKHEVFTHMVVEPWKTKFHWGGIVQLILVFLVIALQFCT